MPSKLTSAAVGALLTASALASPTQWQQHKPSYPTCKVEQEDANFDDLTALPGVNLTPVQTPYKGLLFQSFVLVEVVQTNLLPGVLPHSGNNVAGAGLTSELAGTPMLTTNYPDSNVTSFTLEDFYFGCDTQLENGVTALPSACDVAIAGYRGSDNSISNSEQVCAQQFRFNPTTSLGPVQMAYSGAVKGCKDIQFAVVQFSPPGGAAATAPLLGLALDNVKYTTCSK